MWLLLCASAVQAEAKSYRVAVLSLGIDRVDDALARELSERLRAELAQQPGYVLHDSRLTLEQLSLAQDCDADRLECLERIAQQLEVDGLVFGQLSDDSGAAVAELQRYDVASHRLRGSALATLALSDAAPDDVASKAQQLIGDLFELTPARSPFSRGQAQPQAEPDQEVLPSAPQPSTAPSARQVAGYALLGGAVVSAGLSVLSFVQIDRAQASESFERYRRNVGAVKPSVRDVCDEASSGRGYGLDPAGLDKVKGSCSSGKTFEILQFLFIGGAVLSGGLSAYMLLGGAGSSDRPATSSSGRITLRPSISKGGASLGARISF